MSDDQLEWIYLSPPDIGVLEREFLLDALESNWIAPLGPHVDAFEAELAIEAGVPNAVALSSGTAALHLGLVALGVTPGAEVLVPTLTFAATAFAVVYVGARPMLVDSASDTWNLDPGLVAEELERRAREGRLPAAVIAVDLYGQCAEWDELEAACEAFDVPLLEDAAEALGARYRSRPAGSFGRGATFSFNGNKIITTSGGGMFVSRDPALARRVRHLANQARESVPHYEHREVGYNYRLSNLLAAVGRAQLRGLTQKIAARRWNYNFYRDTLAGVPGIQFSPHSPGHEPNCWLTCITLDPDAFGASAAEVQANLRRQRIDARPVWKPMHLQPVFAECPTVGGGVAARIYERGLCLPSGSSLTAADRARVVDALLSSR